MYIYIYILICLYISESLAAIAQAAETKTESLLSYTHITVYIKQDTKTHTNTYRKQI